MNINDKDFSVTFTRTKEAGTICFSGSLRLRNAPDYDSIKKLLKEALTLELKQVTLDFRDLAFLNSSAIGTIATFVLDVKKAANSKLILRGSKAHPWHVRSLKTLKRIHPAAELIIEEETASNRDFGQENDMKASFREV